MAGRKRAVDPTGCDPASTKKAKRQVSVSTFEKWQRQFEREHQALAWMRCDVEPRDKSHVASLYCSACRKYEDRIRGMKNFSMVWLTGSTNQKTSNVLDHANSEQHKAAMARVRADHARASNEPVTTYATIARCLSTLDDETRGRLRRKFDLCYLMAKESMPFAKYPALHELEVRHGVNLGSAYCTPDSAKAFTGYIADSQRQAFLCSALAKSHFFSFLMDGTTDAGNQEDELIVLQYFLKDDLAQEIRSSTRYFSVHTPEKADASGLLKSLADALKCMDVGDIFDKASVLGVKDKPVLVGGGTDGASVNVAQHNGMRGRLQGALPWLFWSWCYAHRLELACKDAFASPLCGAVLEMLLRLYYLYEKSPKKSRELTTIAEDLKEVFELPRGGSLPIRSNGTRWISHKRKALQRVVDRYGVYINHLTTLAEDKSLKSDDRARLKGYLLKWRHSKILIGCAMYVDAMKPASLLSLTLQDHCVDIVLSIEHILKTSKALKSLQAKDPLEWPTVKLVRDRIKKVGEESEYQGATLKSFNTATLEYCKGQALSDLQRLDLKMRERLEWTDTTLLRSLLAFIETRSWTSVFQSPLEAKGVATESIQDEVEEAVEYARKYLTIGTNSYKTIWYKLHTCPDSRKWPNVLLLCELVFSLPFSNSRVEQIFSSLKMIKTKIRTNLSTSTLHNLLELNIEGPPLSSFNPDAAVELWWKDCNTTRRVRQQPRKQYRPRKNKQGAGDASEGSSESDEEQVMILEEWDRWFSPDSDPDDADSSDDSS